MHSVRSRIDDVNHASSTANRGAGSLVVTKGLSPEFDRLCAILKVPPIDGERVRSNCRDFWSTVARWLLNARAHLCLVPRTDNLIDNSSINSCNTPLEEYHRVESLLTVVHFTFRQILYKPRNYSSRLLPRRRGVLADESHGRRPLAEIATMARRGSSARRSFGED